MSHKRYIAWRNNGMDGWGIVGENDDMDDLVEAIIKDYGLDAVPECLFTEYIPMIVKVVRGSYDDR